MKQLLKYTWMVPLACGLGSMATPLAAQDKQSEEGDVPPPAEVKVSPGLDKLNGFRGVPFGTPFENFKTLKLSQDRGPLKLYVDDTDSQLIGPVLLDEIVYYFFEGKFTAVALHTSDGNDTSNAIRIMEGAYGPGTPLSSEDTYLWKGNQEAVRLSVSEDGDAEIFISNNELYKAFLDTEEKEVQAAIAELKNK